MNLTLSAIRQRVQDRIQKTDPTYANKINRFINDRYDHIVKRQSWKDLVRHKESGVTFVAGNAFLFLPTDVGRILVVAERANNRVLSTHSPYGLWTRYSDTIDTQANPITFTYAGVVASIKAMSVADQIEVLSSSGSDGSAFMVRILGTVSGVIRAETIILNGTTPVASVNTYDAGTVLEAVGKSATTTGVITVREQDADTTLATLAPDELTSSYKRIRLYNVPSAADTVSVIYIIEPKPLVNDLDVPQFDCAKYLVEGAYTDCLREQRRFAHAGQQENVAESELFAMLQQEQQDVENVQLVPQIEQRD